MKIITRFIAALSLLSCSFKATSQDSLFATTSIYRCGIHYVILFHYKRIADSTRQRIITLHYRVGNKDSIAKDTEHLSFFSSKALMYQEVANGTDQLTEPHSVTFVEDDKGDDEDFLRNIFSQLCNQPKKQILSPDYSKPQPTVAGHTAHWKPAIKRGDGSLWMIGGENKGDIGDTIVLSGAYSYAYICEDYSSQVVIYTDGKQVTVASGFSIENTNNLKVDGSGGDSLYGIRVNGGGTDVTITGKSNYIDVGYMDLRNGGIGGIFDKTEVSDVSNKYDCDPSYLYPTLALNHHLHHLRLTHIQGDGLYEGSTGSTGGRPMNCGGTTTYPKPMGCGFVELDHIIMDSINRQGGQVSGSDSGYALVHDNIITNTGYEYNSSQGAGWAIGGGSRQAKFYKNIINHTFLYNFYTYGDGVTEVYDNVMDSAGQVGTKGSVGWKINPQQLPSTLFSPQNYPSTLKIHDNITGYNTALNQGKPVGYVIYGDSTVLTTTGNVFCNNIGNLQNTTGITFKEDCKITDYSIAATADANTIIEPSGVTVVDIGGTQTYSIVANRGFSIADVVVDGVAVGAVSNYTFSNVQANHIISATSLPKPFSIVSFSQGGGKINPQGLTRVTAGESQSYTMVANTGFEIDNVVVDGANIGAVTNYTFENVTAKHTIRANFRVIVPNMPPVAVAAFEALFSKNKVVTSLTGTSSSDSDGSIVSYKWKQVSGASTVSISDQTAVTTEVTGFTSGNYQFSLTVTDNEGASSTSNIIIVVDAAIATVSKQFGVKFTLP